MIIIAIIKNKNKIPFYIEHGNGTILLYYRGEKNRLSLRLSLNTRKQWMEFKMYTNILTGGLILRLHLIMNVLDDVIV